MYVCWRNGSWVSLRGHKLRPYPVQEAEEYDRQHRAELRDLKEDIEKLDAQLGPQQQSAGKLLHCTTHPALSGQVCGKTSPLGVSHRERPQFDLVIIVMGRMQTWHW